MTASLLDKSLVYVTGKGGVGKTTVAAAIGLAARPAGGGRSSARSPHQDRVSRAFARHGVREETEIELEQGLWAITIDPEAALREWLSRAARRAARCGCWRTRTRSSTSSPPRPGPRSS